MSRTIPPSLSAIGSLRLKLGLRGSLSVVPPRPAVAGARLHGVVHGPMVIENLFEYRSHRFGN